jgi:hypothetical protein
MMGKPFKGFPPFYFKLAFIVRVADYHPICTKHVSSSGLKPAHGNSTLTSYP